ncbi:MAG TPA: hypothetical protein VGH20_05650 [Myxococcales bacterium]
MRPWLALFLAAACAIHTPAPQAEEPAAASPTAANRAFVESVREEYQALGHIQGVLSWYSGTVGEPSISKLTYLGHDRLFRKRALEAIAQARAQPGVAPNEALALSFLTRSLESEVLSLSLAHFDDEYADAEASAIVTLPWQSAPMAYRDVQAFLAQEPDAQRRAEAYAAMNAVRVQKLNPILATKEEAAKATARETGFSDYVALSEELRQVKLDDLLAQGVAYVKATDGLFQATLDRVAEEELHVPAAQLHVADIGRLNSAPGLSRYFDRSLEMPALRAFLEGIGLDLRTAAGTEVLVDDGTNPKKRPRAFVQPVDAPRDVRLSVKPSGGLDDYETLFHEAGHAVHFASATVSPHELVGLGYSAPTEGFGEFFRHAFSDPRFLRRYGDFLVRNGRPRPSNRELAAVERRLALREMFYLRRYAFAKIAYELRLHGRPAREIAPALALLKDPAAASADLRTLYRELFSRAYGFELTGEEAQSYLADVDDTFYAADYARAFVLAGMMHAGMKKRFGDDWYGNRQVGKFLRTMLFAPGTSLSVDDVAHKLGFAHGLDFAFAAARAKRLVAEADALEKKP